MSEVMHPVPFLKLLEWVKKEFEQERTIFGIAEDNFYMTRKDKSGMRLWNSYSETPCGPAAGPHTQCAQNIGAAYLSGGRFFELKTVQILDELDIDKPCIEAEHEGYNTEWSTELTVEQAFREYVKSWFLLHYLKEEFLKNRTGESGFIFNMSVGYDLKGIKSKKIDNFIESLKNAGTHHFFEQCREEFNNFYGREIKIPEKIADSITLSTMHGCPPEEQEAICRYLLREKKLHTFLKLNPTLLGYEFVSHVLKNAGFNCKLKEESFTNDLQYKPAVEMIKRLIKEAKDQGLEFGVKLTNTLPVENFKAILPGDEMYMSGRALYPLTVNLAAKLSSEFDGRLPLSYCGGANAETVVKIYRCGIRPITMATELLKPGGYSRLVQMVELLEQEEKPGQIEQELLQDLAASVLKKKEIYQKYALSTKSNEELPLWNCVQAGCQSGCPLNQDIPSYIRAVRNGDHRQALKIILKQNPLPHITGNICEHPCRMKCTRIDYDDPLQIREIKKEAAEKGYESILKEIKAKETGNVKAAVIGAGPAGLAAAYFLRKSGINADVYEKEDKPGGLVRYIIPSFRLPESAIDRDINLMKKTGVRIKCGRAVNIRELKGEGYKYILLAIGAAISRDHNLAGDCKKLISGLEFLRNFKEGKTGDLQVKDAVIIGGGNSAMDSARAALRLPGIEKVTIVYRRTVEEMPADREEYDNALAEGVVFEELLQPVRLNEGKLFCQPMRRGEKDTYSRRKVFPSGEENKIFEPDIVISAIGEEPDRKFLSENGISLIRDLTTNLENVYVIGDAFRGPSSVVQAMADGMNAAEMVLQKEHIAHSPKDKPALITDRKDLARKKAMIRREEKDISEETERCLECDLICSKCVEVCPNRANVALRIKGTGLIDEFQIIHLDKLCNECGNCDTFCPYNGAPYRDKFTLYSEKEAFEQGKNDGLYFDEQGNIIFRYSNITEGKEKDAPAEIIILKKALMEKYSYLLEI